METEFKACSAVQLENDNLKVVILPSIGGKIASIYNKGKAFELLFQNKAEEYKKPRIYDDFGLYDASGFDDAFPTIDECRVNYGGKEVIYPNHGEIWSSDFKYSTDGEKVTLSGTSSILPYGYEKTIYLKDSCLVIEYRIANYGEYEMPCIWAMHCLINCEEDMQLVLPQDTIEVINVLKSDYLGEAGQVHSYPVTRDIKGSDYHLDRILSRSSGKMEKYYVRGKIAHGCCGVVYPSQDVSFNIYFDKNKLPYLGFWITEGGFRGDYNCALEPTNGYYDNIDTAKRQNSLFLLKAGEKLAFDIRLELK